jgi:type VI secretion system protein ImpA
MEISHIADTEKQAKRIALGGITLKDIETAKSETNKQFFITLHADLIACHTSYDQLSYFLDTEIGNESPPSSRIRNALTQCLDTLTFLAGSILNQSKPIPDSEDQSAAPSIQRTFNISTTNLDRDAAFETLQTIANYFRQTEPHSPLSYLIQKTIQWGKLSLPQLLEELIKDDDVRKQLFTLTGIEAQ